MKKRLLFVAAIVAASTTFAQDGLTSKKGEAYLPEAGDWAIGIDANPLLNYVGNLANGNVGNSFGGANWFGGVPSQTIYGKMFKDEKTAYRAMVRIGFGSQKSEDVVMLYADSISKYNTTKTEFVNETKNSGRQITLGFGIEKRRGNTRIQGVYGAQLLMGFGGSSTTYSYGMPLSEANVTNNPTDIYGETYTYTTTSTPSPIPGFPATETTTIDTTANNPRVLKEDHGSTFMIGLQGFIGVEWFFAPKVSLGAEYTWGLSMTSNGASSKETEKWGVTGAEANLTTVPADHLITETTNGGKSSSFGIDTGLSGAKNSLNFHF